MIDKGRPFASTMESSQNLYAVQWHPEKNAFENAREHDGTVFSRVLITGPEAVAATFALAQSFVGRARASRHRFVARDAWRFENCVALRTHRPDFVGAYDLPLAWDMWVRRRSIVASTGVSALSALVSTRDVSTFEASTP